MKIRSGKHWLFSKATREKRFESCQSIRCFAIGAVLCLSTLSGLGQLAKGGYYVFDGKRVSLFTSGDPNQVQVKEWQIWLYPRGVTPGVPHMGKDGYWGACKGRTVADVEKQLKDGQKEEITFDRFAGKPAGSDLLTYFNPFGPIAIVGSSPQQSTNESETAASDLRQLSEWGRKLGTLGRFASKIQAAVSDYPSYQVGSRVQDYIQNLETAEKSLEQLKMLLNNSTDKALSNFQSLVSQITDSIENAEILQPQIMAELNPRQKRKTKGQTSPSATTNDLLDPLAPNQANTPSDLGELGLSSADSIASPGYAQKTAERSTKGIESLIDALGNSENELLQIGHKRQQLSDQLNRIEWNKNARLGQLRANLGSGMSLQNQRKTWITSGGDPFYVADGKFSYPAAGASGYIALQHIAKISYSTQEGTTVELDMDVQREDLPGTMYVIFDNHSDADAFKQTLEQFVVEATHPIRQADIDSSERNFDNQIANLKAQLLRLDAEQKHLHKIQDEARTQIAYGAGLWQIAVTFEVALIRRDAYIQFQAVQHKKQKIESHLAQLHKQLGKTQDSQQAERLREDEATWKRMLDKLNTQQAALQQRAKQLALQASQNKLSEYQELGAAFNNLWDHYKGELVPCPSPSTAPGYAPIRWTDSATITAGYFRFGQLESLGSSAHQNSGSSDEMNNLSAFISDFTDMRDKYITENEFNLDDRQDKLMLETTDAILGLSKKPKAPVSSHSQTSDGLPLP